ncbi:MAG TPA: hypothetical protein DEF02_00005, partial [Clostridiales bacterium]|nr:hypothetical protein [Clostridiales bacterium]
MKKSEKTKIVDPEVKKRKKRKVAIVLSVVFLLPVVAASVAIGGFAIWANTQKPNVDLLPTASATPVFFDSSGNELPYTEENYIATEDIPDNLKNAFVALEDKRFYSHGGVDYIRLARAAWNNFRAHSFKEGASTISQQLIKNTHLSQEKTIKRKLLELKLTSELEARYTKDEILEKYLNSIYFGHSCFGVKSAAEFYFSKSPEDLSLADGALLAGIVKSPNNYSPFKNPAKCLSRRALVLEAMQKNGHISEAEKLEAENAPLPVQNAVSSADSSYLARCYDELERLADENSLRLNGEIRIFTYLDPSLQKTLSDTCALRENDERSDIISAALDLASGGFVAYYSTCGDIARSPASLFKPLCAYAPAFEEGLLSPATPIDDSPVSFGGYSPKNYGGTYGGYL